MHHDGEIDGQYWTEVEPWKASADQNKKAWLAEVFGRRRSRQFELKKRRRSRAIQRRIDEQIKPWSPYMKRSNAETKRANAKKAEQSL